MCIIIVNARGTRLPKSVLSRSAQMNPDGLGIVWLDNYEVSYHQSAEWSRLQSDRPFIAHFRFATVGDVSMRNVHPFVCGNNKDELLMMNGTIFKYGSKTMTDTEHLARLLGDKRRQTWASELAKFNHRFVTINTKHKSYQIYNKSLWTNRDGVWYSKSNILHDNYVAVYGTLKRGQYNNQFYLYGSEFIGHGVTKHKYPLIVSGLPYLIEQKGSGLNVAVDVFRVDDATLFDLDKLEGHPRWYIRKSIPIVVNEVELMCWVYFNPSARYKYNGQNHVQSYSDNNVCVDCMNDLEYDGYNSYYCKSCGSWQEKNNYSPVSLKTQF